MYLWIIATLVAYFIKGLCGFANTLVFTSILGFGANNVAISPVELVLGYPSNIILAWDTRKKLDKKVFIPLSIIVILGSLPGAFLLKNVDAKAIKIVFGVLVMLLGIEMLLREANLIHVKDSKIMLAIIGITSGVICGLFGVGVLLAAYVSRTTDTTEGFKANMSAVFIVENTFRIITYSVLGIITANSLKLSFMLMPFMLIGVFAGIKSSRVLDEKLSKKIVIILLIISGIMLIAKNI